MRHKGLWVFTALAVMLLVIPIQGASAASTGGCPNSASEKWTLAWVEGLGIAPEVATGIASLDGNGDGKTCIRKLHASEGTICNMDNQIVFRDNTVAGATGTPLDCQFGPT